MLAAGMNDGKGALLTDLYQLTMIQAYLARGKTGTAVFEFFMRHFPPQRGFLIAAGLEQALDFLETLRFTRAEIEWLKASGRFSDDLISYLEDFRFTGDVDAMQEGTAFFADEPILRVTAPLPEAQLVESRLINLLHYQTLIASKAARMVLIAPDKTLVDFGFRRAHGAEAGVLAARASYIAGFSGTATVLAGTLFGIPLSGTMAHSFIEVFDSEVEAFESFARERPEHLTLLIDTYDVEAAARKIVTLARRLADAGIAISGVRIDSGDLIALSRRVRQIFDAGGLRDVTIFASGGIDERELRAMIEAQAPIDGFGIGTSLTTSFDLPALDCAYKLQEYAGLARRKRSVGKATWPGRKQVWRRHDADGRMAEDLIALEGQPREGERLIEPVMRGGRRVVAAPKLAAIRARAAAELQRLPEPLRALAPGLSLPVRIDGALEALAAEVDRRLEQREKNR